MSVVAEYPSGLVREHHLFDGTEVTIRPVRIEDAAMETSFIHALSEESRYYRFLAHVSEASARQAEEVAIDYDTRMALLAIVNTAGRELEIGAARYVVKPDGSSCEFAIAVDDRWQGSGVAGLLMADLMNIARARGLKTMEATVLSSNHKMLKFAHQLGFTIHRLQEDDTVWITRAL